MGWNCVVSVADGVSLSDLTRAGAVVGDATVTGDDATSSSYAGTTVWERPGRVVFLNTDLQLLDDLPRICAELGVPVLTALFHSVSDSWMWQVDRPGEMRRRMWHAGEEAEDSGTPHPAEDVTAPLDEDSLADLLGRATGVWLNHDMMWADVRSPGRAERGPRAGREHRRCTRLRADLVDHAHGAADKLRRRGPPPGGTCCRFRHASPYRAHIKKPIRADNTPLP